MPAVCPRFGRGASRPGRAYPLPPAAYPLLSLSLILATPPSVRQGKSARRFVLVLLGVTENLVEQNANAYQRRLETRVGSARRDASVRWGAGFGRARPFVGSRTTRRPPRRSRPGPEGRNATATPTSVPPRQGPQALSGGCSN